jgi:hypothetical protein
MKKTSVYLTEEEAAGLRRLAVREGTSQAELIRDGIRRRIADAQEHPREFKSLAAGRGGGRPYEPWDSQRLYEKTFGKS